MQQSKFPIVVLVSGNGSNLQALIDESLKPDCTFAIAAVISNKEQAFGLERARKAGIPARVIDHRQFSDREQFDQALATTIDDYTPRLVVLAGFMRILSDDFVLHFSDRMINIHPSLLPKYKGLNTHQRVLDAGDKRHGASVHLVTAQLDDGPVILQGAIDVRHEDDAHTLAQRVHAVEHKILPLVVTWFAQARLQSRNNILSLDHQPLNEARQLDPETNQVFPPQST